MCPSSQDMMSGLKSSCEIMTHTINVSSFNILPDIQLSKSPNINQFPIFNQLEMKRLLQKSFFKQFCTIQQQIERLKDNNYCNITPRIIQNSQRQLLKIPNHPLSIIKQQIKSALGTKFKSFEDLNPVVTAHQNFDVLNIPQNHISRQPTDTYYINSKQLLRTHTSAHQNQLLTSGLNDFVVFGDVYRRDEIDRYHYPVFHQMEAVSMLGDSKNVSLADAENDLKKTIQKIVDSLFGKCEKRWIEGFFPFTNPSFQLEIFYDNKWVEMLGCGVIHEFVLNKSGRATERGWAAGLGLERFAMKLFKIPDVRLFWCEDARFLNQFSQGKITEYKQISKYPLCYKDLSMWIGQTFNSNDLFGIIRQIGGDLVQSVEEISTYKDQKTGKTSKAYRICFRSLERTLQNHQISDYQFKIREEIKAKLRSVELRGGEQILAAEKKK